MFKHSLADDITEVQHPMNGWTWWHLISHATLRLYGSFNHHFLSSPHYSPLPCSVNSVSAPDLCLMLWEVLVLLCFSLWPYFPSANPHTCIWRFAHSFALPTISKAVEIQNWMPSYIFQVERLHQRPSNLSFSKPSRWLCCWLKSENYWNRLKCAWSFSRRSLCDKGLISAWWIQMPWQLSDERIANKDVSRENFWKAHLSFFKCPFSCLILSSTHVLDKTHLTISTILLFVLLC